MCGSARWRCRAPQGSRCLMFGPNPYRVANYQCTKTFQMRSRRSWDHSCRLDPLKRGQQVMSAFDGPSLPQRQPTAVTAFRGNAAAPPAKCRGQVLPHISGTDRRIGSHEQPSPRRRSTRATARCGGPSANLANCSSPGVLSSLNRDAAALEATLLSAGLCCPSPARRGITP
jgi:hypothetical protein